MMHGHEKSDSFIVPEKPANGSERAASEPVEGRGEAKGNAVQVGMRRTPSRESMSHGLGRVRQAAKTTLRRYKPEVGARCPNWARRVLCGGREVTHVPTATSTHNRLPDLPSSDLGNSGS